MIIKAATGEEIQVDEIDFNFLNQYTWKIINGYPKSTVYGKVLCMHTVLIGRPGTSLVVDHINGNKFDNRRINLRLVTRQQNNLNRDMVKNASGVFFRGNKRWIAHCRDDYKLRSKSFKTEAEAKQQREVWVKERNEKYPII